MAVDLKNIYVNQEKSNSIKNNKFGKLIKKEFTLKNKLSDKKKERFFSQLHVLLSSGMDLQTTLEIIINEQKKENDKLLFKNVLKNIIKGESFSTSIELTNKFNNYELFSIEIGEETGRLDEVLKDLSHYYSKKIKLLRQIKSAVSYPILVVFTAIGAVIFMLNYIVPTFNDIFVRAGKELPGLTRTIINISDKLNYYFWIFLVISGFPAVFILLTKNKKKIQAISSNIILRIPFFGGLIRMIYLEKFFQSMELLIRSKISIVKATEMVGNMISFFPLQEALIKINDGIMRGKPLYQCMAVHQIFDPKITSLIMVGEEVNQLDNIFNRLYTQYTEELEHKIELLSKLLEPLLIVLVGGLVAIILIAMYLPMFQMGTSVF